MYNGIGVQTARGTGTSGHVTKNLSAIRPMRGNQRRGREEGEYQVKSKEVDPGILLHNSLRNIEISLVRLRDELENEYVSSNIKLNRFDRGLSEEVIDQRIQEQRELLRRGLSSEASNRELARDEAINAAIVEKQGRRFRKREENKR